MLSRSIILWILFIWNTASSQAGQSIFIKGKITDAVGSPVQGVQVMLTRAPLLDTTDQNGDYEITNIPSASHPRSLATNLRALVIRNNNIHFSIDNNHRQLYLCAYTLSGSKAGSVLFKDVSPGNYQINLQTALRLHTSGVYILRAIYGNEILDLGRTMLLDGKLHIVSGNRSTSWYMSKSGEQSATQIPAIDTLVISKKGLRSQRKPLYYYSYEYDLNFRLIQNKAPYFRTLKNQIQSWAIAGDEYRVTFNSYDDDDFEQLQMELLNAHPNGHLVKSGGRIDTLYWVPTVADTGSHPFSVRVFDSNGAADTLSWMVKVIVHSGSWKTVGSSGFSSDSSRNIKIRSHNGTVYVAYTVLDTTKQFKSDTNFLTNSTSPNMYEGISVQRYKEQTWEYYGQPCFLTSFNSTIHVFDFEFDSAGTPYISVNGDTSTFNVLKYEEGLQSWIQIDSHTGLSAGATPPRNGPEIGFTDGAVRVLYGSSFKKDFESNSNVSSLFVKQWSGTTWTTIDSILRFNDNIDDRALFDGVVFDIAKESIFFGLSGSSLRLYQLVNNKFSEIKTTFSEKGFDTYTINAIVQHSDSVYIAYSMNKQHFVKMYTDSTLLPTGDFADDGWMISDLSHDGTDCYALMLKMTGLDSGYQLRVLKNRSGTWFPAFGSTIDDFKFDHRTAFGSARGNVSFEVVNGIPYIAFIDKKSGNRVTVIKYDPMP